MAIDWRKIAADLAWSRVGQPHTPAEQAALDAYDAAVFEDQFFGGDAGDALRAHIRQEDTGHGRPRSPRCLP